MITVAVFLAQTGAARGDINRFTSPQRLVGYLGLDPRVRQSGNGPGHTGHISKEGAAAVRHVLVESALTAIRSPGPVRGFYLRVRARRGHPIAIVATARKMAKLFWHLLIREQDYAYTLPTAMAKKIRTIALKAGHPLRPAGGNRHPLNREQHRIAERQIPAHEQTIADWQRHARATGTPTPARNFHPSLRYLVQRRDVQRLVGNEPLQPGALRLELLQALQFVGLHPTELVAPPIEPLLGHLKRP
jgi:transposase